MRNLLPFLKPSQAIEQMPEVIDDLDDFEDVDFDDADFDDLDDYDDYDDCSRYFDDFDSRYLLDLGASDYVYDLDFDSCEHGCRSYWVCQDCVIESQTEAAWAERDFREPGLHDECLHDNFLDGFDELDETVVPMSSSSADIDRLPKKPRRKLRSVGERRRLTVRAHRRRIFAASVVRDLSPQIYFAFGRDGSVRTPWRVVGKKVTYHQTWDGRKQAAGCRREELMLELRIAASDLAAD